MVSSLYRTKSHWVWKKQWQNVLTHSNRRAWPSGKGACLARRKPRIRLPQGGTCPNDFSDPIDQDIRTKWALSWKIVVSEWRSVIAVSLNVGGGIRLIKPAKLSMWTQKHYKQDEDGHKAPGVCGNGSALSHSGNVVTRIGRHTHTFLPILSEYR